MKDNLSMLQWHSRLYCSGLTCLPSSPLPLPPLPSPPFSDSDPPLQKIIVNHMAEPAPSQEEPSERHQLHRLQRYLQSSMEQSGQSPCPHRPRQWSARKPVKQMEVFSQQQYLDESKTERRSYNRDFEQPSRGISPRLGHNQHQMKLVSEKLRGQNQDLRQKALSLQEQVQRLQALVRGLQKKSEMGEQTRGEQVKQLRRKLQESEWQLHEWLQDKDRYLSMLQLKQKEYLGQLKQRERAYCEQKRRTEALLDKKQKTIYKHQREVIEMKQLVVESQDIVEQLNYSLNKSQGANAQLKSLVQEKDGLIARIEEQLREAREGQQEQGVRNEQEVNSQRAVHQLSCKNNELQAHLAQNNAVTASLQLELDQLRTALKQKQVLVSSLLQENNWRQSKLDELSSTEGQLRAKLHRFEAESRSEQRQGQFIGSQIKTVELQLTKVKLQSEYETASRAKKLTEYERINELLNKKIELLAQENLELLEKYITVQDRYGAKEEQNYQLGQELSRAKEGLIIFESQCETLREQRDFLESRVRELQMTEEEAAKYREKGQHLEKAMVEIEQREQLRVIELVNEIRAAQAKGQEKEEQLVHAKQELGVSERQIFQLQSQIQNLRYTIRNLQAELQLSKTQQYSFKDTSGNFQEKMLALQRTEANSGCSIEELQEDNLNLKLMVRQNQSAITILGRRYDALLKGTLLTLTHFSEIMKQSKNMANQTVKHQKAQISTILNDTLRFTAQQQKKQSQHLSSLQSELGQQRSRNGQRQKIIKIKGQMIEQLQQQLQKYKNQIEAINSRILHYETEIVDYQRDVRDKMAEIRELKQTIQTLRKEQRETIKEREQLLQLKQKEIRTVKEEMNCNLEKAQKREEEIKQKHQGQVQEFNDRIEASMAKIAELENCLKSQKQAGRLQKIKSADLLSTIAKNEAEKQTLQGQIQKRTKDLISVRVESDYRYKLIIEKQGEISQMKRATDKLQKQKESSQTRRKNLEEGNKAVVLARNELEAALKGKNDELLEMKNQLSQAEITRNRLTKTKDDLLASKKMLQQNIRELNQNMKNLKDNLLASEQQHSVMAEQAEERQKDYGRQVSSLKKENQVVQKQLQALRLKKMQGVSSPRNNEVCSELQQVKHKNEQYVQQITRLRDQLQKVGSKLTAKGQNSGQKALSPAEQRDYRTLISELIKNTKSTEQNHSKLQQVASKRANSSNVSSHLVSFSKDLVAAINKMKISVLTRKNLEESSKKVLLEEVKLVQNAGQRIMKVLASDIY